MSIGDYMIVFALLLVVVPVAMAVVGIDPQYDKRYCVCVCVRARVWVCVVSIG